MNFKPCADEFFISKNSVNHIIVEKGTDHQHNEKDECSPFCYCACCSVRSFSATEITITFFSQQTVLDKPSFMAKPTHQISLPIWQPPQLV